MPQSGLVLVAGANNTGKSALLSALDVIAGDIGDLSHLQHGGSSGDCQVNAIFALTPQERELILERDVTPDDLQAGVLSSLEFRFTASIDGRSGISAGMGLREVRGVWGGGEMIPLIKVSAAPGGMAIVEMAARLGHPAQQSTMDLVSIEEPRRQLDWLDRMIYESDGKTIIDPFKSWQSRLFHFRALRQGSERTQPLASAARLDPRGTNLSAVLHWLLTDQPKVFDRLGELVSEIVPEIGRLRVRTLGSQRIVFEGDAGDMNLKDLGTGVEQLLMILVVGLTEAPPFLMLVEEPETNLHPAAQRALLGLFQAWSADRQIVLATHSTVMLDWTPGGEGLWLTSRNDGASELKPVGEDRLGLLMESLGVRPF